MSPVTTPSEVQPMPATPHTPVVAGSAREVSASAVTQFGARAISVQELFVIVASTSDRLWPVKPLAPSQPAGRGRR
jgi:hypothetical protein